MSPSSVRLQRFARRTVVLLLVSVNAVLILLNLQKHDVVSSEWLDLESVLGLTSDEQALLPDTMAFAGSGSRAQAVVGADGIVVDEFGRRVAGASAASAVGVAAMFPVEVWPGGTPVVPDDPPEQRQALLADDGSVRLVGAVPNWSAATELADHAGARLPDGEDAVVIDYSWHPDASADGRDGVVRLADPLLYAPGQAAVPVEAEPGLDVVAEILVANPAVFAVVVGYTDDLGESSENAAVAFARSSAVLSYLQATGVAVGQVVIAAPRAEEPLGSNGTVEGRLLNRRLEIELVNFLSGSGPGSGAVG